jgi:nucleoside-diphosphate-sugar epimerase
MQDGEMRRALVTGSSGQVGGPLVERLRRSEWEVREFDVEDGDDLRDEGSVVDAVAGCDAVVHAGALAHDSAGSPSEIVATNVLGTWHVLLAAEQHSVARVVFFSSAQVFGCAEGEGTPDYLPLDDAHPLRAARPYGLSKRLAEEMCKAWTDRTGIPTIALRPVLILDDAGLQRVHRTEAELDAFVHVDDVIDAARRAIETEIVGHHRLLLCGPGHFDTKPAQRLLGWTPHHDWPA